MIWLLPLLMLAAGSLAAEERFRMGVGFADPTTRYAHGVLGDAIEFGTLFAELEGERISIELPFDRVFEDLQPRLANVAGDAAPEIIVVETDIRLGAQLAVYRASFSVFGHSRLTKIAATPHIGRTHRWLAPVGIADFDGDGQNDIAYVETPHLGRILRIVTLREGELVEIASTTGLTNHRIGDDYISGGVRNCGDGPELVLLNNDWSRVMGVALEAGNLQVKDLAANSPKALANTLACIE